LWALESLERAILEFGGTVIFVTHDRYFMNRVADHLLIVEPGRFRRIEGNYDTYLHLQRSDQGGNGQAKAGGSRDSEAKLPAEPDNGKPVRRKRKFPYRKVAELEAEIQQREAVMAALHASLADPDVYRSGERMRETQTRIEQEKATLTALYEHWEEACELNGQ
jgi:ATP-binding cassette subfamily F protein 3